MVELLNNFLHINGGHYEILNAKSLDIAAFESFFLREHLDYVGIDSFLGSSGLL